MMDAMWDLCPYIVLRELCGEICAAWFVPDRKDDRLCAGQNIAIQTDRRIEMVPNKQINLKNVFFRDEFD